MRSWTNIFGHTQIFLCPCVCKSNVEQIILYVYFKIFKSRTQMGVFHCE